jgi:hypothetical protein
MRSPWNHRLQIIPMAGDTPIGDGKKKGRLAAALP